MSVSEVEIDPYIHHRLAERSLQRFPEYHAMDLTVTMYAFARLRFLSPAVQAFFAKAINRMTTHLEVQPPIPRFVCTFPLNSMNCGSHACTAKAPC